MNWRRSDHHQANEELARKLMRNPFMDVERVDHSDVRPDPPSLNGHVPDMVVENRLTGQRQIIETERRGDNSRHTRSQAQAFEKTTRENPYYDSFGLNEFGGERDKSKQRRDELSSGGFFGRGLGFGGGSDEGFNDDFGFDSEDGFDLF